MQQLVPFSSLVGTSGANLLVSRTFNWQQSSNVHNNKTIARKHNSKVLTGFDSELNVNQNRVDHVKSSKVSPDILSFLFTETNLVEQSGQVEKKCAIPKAVSEYVIQALQQNLIFSPSPKTNYIKHTHTVDNLLMLSTVDVCDLVSQQECAAKVRYPFSRTALNQAFYKSMFHLKQVLGWHQIRGFKTVRSIESESYRKPVRERLGRVGNTSAESAAANSSKLKTLLDEDLKPGQTLQQKLYIAFAEAIGINVYNGREVLPEEITVSFDDVKGVDEAKAELEEIVEFLKCPEKFTALGAELPKGVLLVGPPGTGKTLLARAVAGEAGVPFFQAAGPEFDEILVGQGAKRVRDLFRAAKKRAPCVIFIDEIDSVGAKRTNSMLHPYANQTINQLLAEMDGFHKNEGVIVLGATNRRDDLDKALLRPGRFDLEVQVPIPDLMGRRDIFQYYLSKIKTASDVETEVLARGTTGFTGADIKNMVNQAALRAAADLVESVSMKHLETARDKVLMGPEKKSRIPDEEVNLVTAYHESGHTLVSYYTKHCHPLHKVTIIPRGHSLGHTAYIPAKEQYNVTRAQLLAMIDSFMGGRAAEELMFGCDLITSGAADDLKRATEIATHMVKDFGMSDRVGLRTFDDNSQFMGPVGDNLGTSTKETIDAEIKRILQESYERARNILRTHAKEHKALAEALLKYETLDADDIKAILDGKNVSKDI